MMTKAESEMVLAVEAEALFAPPRGRFQGLRPGGAAWLEYVFEPRHSRYLPRAQAELDPGWKQIIPYVALWHDERVFVYRRGQRSTETRLRALHSVGLGGHIRASDEGLFVASGWQAYQAALGRELDEEVSIAGAVRQDRLVGLLNDDTTPVGSVHIGLVHLWELATPSVRARESKIAAGYFAIPAELLADANVELESWSRFLLEQWSSLQRQPGWVPGSAPGGAHSSPLS